MLKIIGIGLCAIAVALIVGLTAAYVATAPRPPPPDSASAVWLEPGPYTATQVDLTLVDTTRPTKANGEYPGAASRTLETTLWYPEAAAGNHPLVIYSHGFMSNRGGGSYLAQALASHGYIVASADYPLTSFSAPGGPEVTDVDQQPGDVSFLIDSILALQGTDKPFSGGIDPERIGLMGLSLGGLTTTLATFHPTMRDPRVSAAVSIAGPAAMFSNRFFATVQTPFLMIAGTADAIVDYQANAAIIPDRALSGALLTIEGGSHTSFASIAEPFMRLMDNPDSIGCGALTRNLSERVEGNPFATLGGAEEGLVFEEGTPGVCSRVPLPESIHPGRQHMITQIGVQSFFDSVFAVKSQLRERARAQLIRNIGNDFPEASFTD